LATAADPEQVKEDIIAAKSIQETATHTLAQHQNNPRAKAIPAEES
jgi:hypothetical protein